MNTMAVTLSSIRGFGHPGEPRSAGPTAFESRAELREAQLEADAVASVDFMQALFDQR
jgi:hypothetical protein